MKEATQVNALRSESKKLPPEKLSRFKSAWRALTGENAKPVVPKRGYRKELPPRRDCEHHDFEHDTFNWTASVGRYEDGSVGEVFLTCTKQGTPVEAAAQDACVTASIALQYGAPLRVVAASLSRDGRGKPQCALGVILDKLLAEAKPT